MGASEGLAYSSQTDLHNLPPNRSIGAYLSRDAVHTRATRGTSLRWFCMHIYVLAILILEFWQYFSLLVLVRPCATGSRSFRSLRLHRTQLQENCLPFTKSKFFKNLNWSLIWFELVDFDFSFEEAFVVLSSWLLCSFRNIRKWDLAVILFRS